MEPYNDIIVADKFTSLLKTKTDLSMFYNVDYSLTESEGTTKRINTYTAGSLGGSNPVQDLTKGNGNTESVTAAYVSKDYTVYCSQERFPYYTEDAFDSALIEAGVQGMADLMANHWTGKVIAEMDNAIQTIECDFSTTSSGYFFGKVVDALAQFGEETDGLYLLISPKSRAYVVKQLADDLKYDSQIYISGYLGSVAGVPLIVSAACGDNEAFIGNRDAITVFSKISTESERERIPNTRQWILYMRKYACVALTNAKKIVKLAPAQSTACAITTYTKNAKTIAGTCGTDCNFVIVTDGDGISYVATPSSGSWSVTAAENLTTGDKINAVAFAPGKASKAATQVTVA